MYRKLCKAGQRLKALEREVAAVSGSLLECLGDVHPEDVLVARERLESIKSAISEALSPALRSAIAAAEERAESPAGWCSRCGSKWMRYVHNGGSVVDAGCCWRCRATLQERVYSKPEDGLAEAFYRSNAGVSLSSLGGGRDAGIRSAGV